jgi:hypothetical protein
MSLTVPVSHHSRRHFLATNALGIGGVALAWLLDQEGLLAEPERPELERPRYDLAPKVPHQPARAKAMISLFMQGGPSHLDLLDPKPALDRYNGTKYPGEVKYDNAAQASATLLASPWKFKKHGQCGTEVSELLPHLAGVVDEITVVRSMHTGVNNHNQSIMAVNTGRPLPGRPALGSWLTYGLGSENRNLPAFVVLTDPGGVPIEGIHNWSNGWLPSLFQGTVVRPREPRILNLDPPAQLRGEPQRRSLAYLDRLNRAHLRDRPGELDLEARIATYELAARMQTAAREALDVGGESPATKKLYGLDDPATREYGTRCLIARRLVERGVRFVQVFTQGQLWDHHGSIRSGLPAACRKTDQPAAALVRDLKSRGLLDSTLVTWGGEMGRLPVIQNDAGAANVGRDHNTYGFSMWLAGGGVKGGCVYGATDEFGHRAVTDVVTHQDYHATLLSLFGLDHRRLVYRRNGREQSLVDGQPCRVVHGILRGA